MSGSPELRAARWAASCDTGTSSKAILGVMTGAPPKSRFCYPHDAGDFGRCVGLLDAVPEYRARLSEVKALGPEWSALVDRWSELEGLYRDGKEGQALLYKRMRALLDPIEKTNSKLLKIGPNASVYFGE